MENKKITIEFEGKNIPDMIFLSTVISDYLTKEEYDCKFKLTEYSYNPIVNNYIDYNKIKPNDYIVVEIGTWYDNDGNEFQNGICYGHINNYCANKWDDKNKEYYQVFNCFETIYADGTIELNGELGASISNKYRYMTNDEIEKFLKTFK